MSEVMDKEELSQDVWRRDRELTLGPMLLLGLFFGLVLLCGLCFGLGYSAGGRGGRDAAAGQPQGAAASAANGQAKPVAAQKAPDAVTVLPVAEASSATSMGGGETAQPQGTSAQPVAAQEEAPAGMLMIQIAAAAHQEDTDALVGALRQRGYAVSVSRDATDGLFHVRVGPFTSRTLANEMRQKLNGDGYNAVVQP
jgi:cell division septation protein DedD